MIKEEAIKVLGDVSAYLASRASLENERLAGHTFTDICKAIKVLRQESCEDCISRQMALDTFGLSDKTRKYGGDHSGYDTIMLYEVQDALEALPSVQPEPFINKPCISEVVCHEDKMKVLEKIRAEIEHLTITEGGEDYTRKMAELYSLKIKVLQIIDKYMAESEET